MDTTKFESENPKSEVWVWMKRKALDWVNVRAETPGPLNFPIDFPGGHRNHHAMLSKVCSAAVNGIDAYPVEVEVNVGYGDTLIVIVVNN